MKVKISNAGLIRDCQASKCLARMFEDYGFKKVDSWLAIDLISLVGSDGPVATNLEYDGEEAERILSLL